MKLNISPTPTLSPSIALSSNVERTFEEPSLEIEALHRNPRRIESVEMRESPNRCKKKKKMNLILSDELEIREEK